MNDVYDLGWIESVAFITSIKTFERREEKKHIFVKAKVSSGEEEEQRFDENESLKRVNMHIVKCPNLFEQKPTFQETIVHFTNYLVY